MFKRYRIRSYEMGLLFRDGEFRSYSDDVTQSAPVNTPRE